jgi:putative endonuclease
MVYIIQSCKDGSFYIGHTGNLQQRLQYHNNGKSRATKPKATWKLVYYEPCNSKGEAMKREKFLKRQRNKGFYYRLIQSEHNPIHE